MATSPCAGSVAEINNRDHRQQARIDQGGRSGQLTQREYDRDRSRLDRVEVQQALDLRANDGYLTAGERAHLNPELDRDSLDIYFSKHDRAKQPGA